MFACIAVQNTAIFTPTGTSAGVGFAIPIDVVRGQHNGQQPVGWCFVLHCE